MSNIAEVHVPIMLDKERMMLFDANTWNSYQEATGNFYLDTYASLCEIMSTKKGEEGEVREARGMEILRKLPMPNLVALIWAAVHEYDAKGEPKWPLTQKQVGRYITLWNLPKILNAFIRGQMLNSPDKEEMGESPAPPSSSPGSALESPQKSAPDTGGDRSIELPADAFS